MKNLIKFAFKSFDEAINVQKQLFKICRAKGYVTFADLFFLTHDDEEERALINSKDIYHNFGWTNLWSSKVEPLDDYANGDYAKNYIIKKGG